ncbi:MAG TPA: hypothetical protein DCY88_27160 [Cyanobacteria bacterium UBA11372]|nr:hypothetical protein [Cyanobacteria bacterium UBA11372]
MNVEFVEKANNANSNQVDLITGSKIESDLLAGGKAQEVTLDSGKETIDILTNPGASKSETLTDIAPESLNNQPETSASSTESKQTATNGNTEQVEASINAPIVSSANGQDKAETIQNKTVESSVSATDEQTRASNNPTATVNPLEVVADINNSSETTAIRADAQASANASDNNSTTNLNSPQTPSFNLGKFKVDATGIVGIDYLFDGGWYEGQLGIFSLTGMEQLIPHSDEFIAEAARRAASNSQLGYVVINDITEGARFSGGFPFDNNLNKGSYLGVKTFNMRPGDTFAIILIPNRATMQQVADKSVTGDDVRPLFSLPIANPDGSLVTGQIADITGEGNTFVMEDLRQDRPNSDRDYNDIIFQVRGAIGSAVSIDSVINPAKEWRTSNMGQALIEYAKAYVTPVDPIVETPIEAIASNPTKPNIPVVTVETPTITAPEITKPNIPAVVETPPIALAPEGTKPDIPVVTVETPPIALAPEITKPNIPVVMVETPTIATPEVTKPDIPVVTVETPPIAEAPEITKPNIPVITVETPPIAEAPEITNPDIPVITVETPTITIAPEITKPNIPVITVETPPIAIAPEIIKPDIPVVTVETPTIAVPEITKPDIPVVVETPTIAIAPEISKPDIPVVTVEIPNNAIAPEIIQPTIPVVTVEIPPIAIAPEITKQDIPAVVETPTIAIAPEIIQPTIPLVTVETPNIAIAPATSVENTTNSVTTPAIAPTTPTQNTTGSNSVEIAAIAQTPKPTTPVKPPVQFEFPKQNQPYVGVIDTGFAGNNPDIDYSRITLGKDRVDGDANPLLQPGKGSEHGTHILGIIAATQNNGIGVDGINDDAPLWLGRAIGSGKWADSLVEFVDAAKKSGQPNAVVNLSLDLTQINPDGSVTTRYELTPEERAAIEYARQHNVLLVVAAGNDGGVMSALGQASQEFDNIITVGAAERVNNAVALSKAYDRANYSSYGYGLDIMAPGGTVEYPELSTVGNGVGTMAGTSVAAAKVTGAVSQVWAANPGLSYRQVIEILKSTATDLKEIGWDIATGAGLVNMLAAIYLAKATEPEEYDVLPTLIPATWSGEGKVTPMERASNFTPEEFTLRVWPDDGVNLRNSPNFGDRGPYSIPKNTWLQFDGWTWGNVNIDPITNQPDALYYRTWYNGQAYWVPSIWIDGYPPSRPSLLPPAQPQPQSQPQSQPQTQPQSQPQTQPQSQPLVGKKIALDPGHGNSPGIFDSGAEGYGTNEAIENMVQAEIIAQYLRQRGAEVKIIDDGSLSLEQIGQQSSGSDLFVSLHLNSFNDSAQGHEVYSHPTAPAVDSRLAQTINSELDAVFPDAEIPNRGVKKLNLAVLRGTPTAVPAVLVESLFIDAPGMSRANVEKAAGAIARGIEKFLTGNITNPGPTQPNTPAPGVPGERTAYKVRNGDTLSGIARLRLGNANRWREITKDPEGRQPFTEAEARLIKPGQTIYLPVKSQVGTGRPVTPPPSSTPTPVIPDWQKAIDKEAQEMERLLGKPVGDYWDATTSPYGTNGKGRNYEHGTVHWSPQYGAVAIWLDLQREYAEYVSPNGSGGWLGFPTKREYPWNGGMRTDFEGGYIFWDGRAKAYRPGELPPRQTFPSEPVLFQTSPDARFRAIYNWAVNNGYAGGFHNFHEANYGPPNGLVYGSILIKREAADWRDIPAAELGNPQTSEQRFRAVYDWAVKNGYAGGYPNFHNADYGQGTVYGSILIKREAADWRDIPASELGNPKNAEELFRAISDWVARNGYVAGYPNFHQANYGNGTVYGVTLLKPGYAEWRDISSRDVSWETAPVTPPPPTQTGRVKVNLNFRRESKVGDNIIRQLPAGTEVKILRQLTGGTYDGDRNQWYEVEVNGQRGYVAAYYVDIVDSDNGGGSNPGGSSARFTLPEYYQRLYGHTQAASSRQFDTPDDEGHDAIDSNVIGNASKQVRALVGGKVLQAKNGVNLSNVRMDNTGYHPGLGRRVMASNYNGTVVIWNEDLQREFWYLHFAPGSINEGLVGKMVNPGDVIGIEGETGWSIGVHTHVHVDNKQGSGGTKEDPQVTLGNARGRGILDKRYK